MEVNKKLKPGKMPPFGKYASKLIDEIGSGYLTWLIDQDWMEEKFPDLLEAVEAEIEWRTIHNQHF